MNPAHIILRRFPHILRHSNRNYTYTAAVLAHFHLNTDLSSTLKHNCALKVQQQQKCRMYSSQTETDSHLDSVTYERVCLETLDALSDYFDELTESSTDLIGSDVSYGDGVLTINLGQPHGIYVINRQTPNKQIWLSSPSSGPKRFDFVGTPGTTEGGKWIYKHTGESLHQLLQLEIPKIIRSQPVNFLQLPYCS